MKTPDKLTENGSARDKRTKQVMRVQGVHHMAGGKVVANVTWVDKDGFIQTAIRQASELEPVKE